MSAIGIFLFLIIVVVGIVAFFLWNGYNRLVTLRARYRNAYAQIDVQLQRRYDLIPNLVETAKGYMKHERETLEAVIAARNQAVTATRQAAMAPGDPQAMTQIATAEAALSGSLGRLFALSEAYPDLKADRSMGAVMEELTSTENKLAFARQGFNDAVTVYNTQREIFPSNLVAGSFGFTGAELWQEMKPAAKEAPRVSF
jgi:LemA protein